MKTFTHSGLVKQNLHQAEIQNSDCPYTAASKHKALEMFLPLKTEEQINKTKSVTFLSHQIKVC